LLGLHVTRLRITWAGCSARWRAGRRGLGAFTAFAVFAWAFLLGGIPRPAADGFIKGADLSFLHEIEDSGGVYTEDGVPHDVLEIFGDHGFNYVRLRLWHDPHPGYNNLEHTLPMAARVKAAGLGLLLDIHYSDSWADPGKQYKPAAWSTLDFAALKDSVYEYTKHVIARFKDEGGLPDMVQIGNEIICGILWDDGRICGGFNTPSQWARLGELITKADRGIKDALGPEDSVAVMIHIDRGGDNSGCRWFFDNLTRQGVGFDVIGLSFYPWWHGTLRDLGANLRDLASRYDKDIVIVETAYPWTLAWYDSVHNIVGMPEQLHPGYPATTDGQRDFLTALADTLRAAPGSRGRGVFYWAPEYISVPGVGSPWENLTLFDFTGEVLPSIGAE